MLMWGFLCEFQIDYSSTEFSFDDKNDQTQQSLMTNCVPGAKSVGTLSEHYQRTALHRLTKLNEMHDVTHVS